jgi:hypothetical protein
LIETLGSLFAVPYAEQEILYRSKTVNESSKIYSLHVGRCISFCQSAL